jgi:NADH:ubiquinone oxidoreductase subunit 2 (subunit N)
LRVVVAMYMSEPEGADRPEPSLAVDPATAVVLVVAVGITLFIGFLPGTFLHFARDATLIFRT